jgi:hypothetical protein
MDGINVRKIEEGIIIEVRFLSDQLKEKIKEELVSICHGEYALVSDNIHHSFELTVKELVNCRLFQNKTMQIGMVGELLLNVMIREFTDMKICSPFFNLEERNPKKGFDIIIVDTNNDLWFAESKAGELGKKETATDKMCEKINEAKRDLCKRLNSDNSQLWLNAISSVRSALKDGSEKDVIIKLLNNVSNTNISSDKNVLLGGTIFCLFDSVVDSLVIEKLYSSILNSESFKKLKIVAIQKQTYKGIISFLHTLA